MMQDTASFLDPVNQIVVNEHFATRTDVDWFRFWLSGRSKLRRAANQNDGGTAEESFQHSGISCCAV
jgi:hypothetical protein